MKRLCLIGLMLVVALELYAAPKQPEGLILYEKLGSNVLVVDKSQCSLSIYQYINSWHKVRQFDCTTGRRKGDKRREGDLKTPTGLYFITNSWTGSELIRQYGSSAKIYGAGAYELDYPNHLDVTLYNKNGSGIWLHGTDKEEPVATRGCIATSNSDLLSIGKYITLEKTPLIIEEKVSYLPEKDVHEIRKKLLTFLESWRLAWESNTENYLQFYSQEFKTKKYNYQEWRKFKRFINKKNKNRQVSFEDIVILKAKGVYNIQFTQHYASTGTNDVGRKYLYVIDTKGKFSIISETWETLPEVPSTPSGQYITDANKKTAKGI